MNNCKTCKHLLFLHKRDINAYCVINEWVFKPTLNYESVTCENYEYKKKIDLGLPSGTLWASCNLGAKTPEENGDYFAWGETAPKDIYLWETYKYNSESALTKYCSKNDYGNGGFTDNLTTLEAKDDAATVNLGKNWHIPTVEEWIELHENCICTRTSLNDVNGYKITGKNGNAIFLPTAGYIINDYLDGEGYRSYYWSSSLYTDNPNYALCMYFNLSSIYEDYYPRCCGRSIRPVYTERE